MSFNLKLKNYKRDAEEFKLSYFFGHFYNTHIKLKYRNSLLTDNFINELQ